MDHRLIHEREKAYFALCVVMSISTYIFLAFTIIGLLYIAAIALVTFIIHGLTIADIKNHGIKLTQNQFPRIYAKTEELAKQLDMEETPDVYIVQSGGILNAFATRFLRKDFIVLYSDIVEITEDGHDEELALIIAHELAHIKRKHITKNLLILPALWTPFLGNAYSRACEYTCDRIAASSIKNPEATTNSLCILGAGRLLFKHVNSADLIDSQEKGFFVWLSHILSTHPPLANRIKEVKQVHDFPEMYGLLRESIQDKSA